MTFQAAIYGQYTAYPVYAERIKSADPAVDGRWQAYVVTPDGPATVEADSPEEAVDDLRAGLKRAGLI